MKKKDQGIPTYLDVVGQEVFQTEGLAEWDLPGQDIRLPHLLDHLVPEFPGEGSFVAQESSAQQAISQQLHLLLLELLQVVQPPGGKPKKPSALRPIGGGPLVRR